MVENIISYSIRNKFLVLFTITIAIGACSNDFLEQKGFVVDYHVYEGLGHSISPDGLSEGLNFIKSL